MDSLPPKPTKKLPVIRTYAREALNHPWLLGAAILGAVGLQAGELIAPLFMRQFFNILATHSSGAENVSRLVGLLGIIAIVSFSSWTVRRIFNFSVLHLESRVMADLYGSSFLYLIRHSYHFFISQFTGTLTRRVSKYANAFETILDSFLFQFFPIALFMSGAFVILFLRNHTLGLIFGIWVVCVFVFQIVVARWRHPIRAARSDEDSRMTGALADAISNQTTIALFSGVGSERARFGEVVSRWRAATMRSWNTDEYIWGALGLFMTSINIGLLYGAIIYWKQGLLTVGDFVLIQTYLIGSFDRLISLNRELRRFYDAYADASEMVEILEQPHEIQDAPGATALVAHHAKIEFKSVNFYFHPETPVLKNFSLTVPAGQKLALVGASGAGKTTATKLLLRLYDVRSGAIEIDGQNIASVTQDSLREHIAFVPQEPVLFHRTLMENIRYGRRTASDAEVFAAAKKAHCHEFIARLPAGYETFVGERGVKLSGGERQRVAIARAILKDAPILVLDEATSSLDSESEALIQDALHALMEGKTVIVIAHRLSTIMKMDRIIVLEGGEIVADGTHEELLEKKGLYHKLWSIQAGGFNKDTEEEERPEDP